jgi:hypothetical protein
MWIKKIKLNKPGLNMRELSAEQEISPEEWKKLMKEHQQL